MSNRIGLIAVLFAACAGALGQENMFKIALVPSGTMVSLNQPTLLGQSYVFQAWPDGAETTLPKSQIASIKRITGKTADAVYQIDLNPSGNVLARDLPTLRNGMFVFHTWRAGTLQSVRKVDVKGIRQLTGQQAFWAEQRQTGEATVGGGLAMEGTSQVVEIGTPPQSRSSQGGRQSISDLNGSGQPAISGAPEGNWLYQGTPGVSDAYAPANATVRSEGDVPRIPAATDGSNPPH